jgi:hypothetical protein
VPTIPPGYSALSPSITANALGGGIGKPWKRFPGALLWMARRRPKRTPADIHESW